jgi:catechol 2,3-dioxygenase-like lactoylglutathione lyase family enzyme
MGIAMNFNKLVVADVPAAERFYVAMGLKVVSRNLGGEDDVRQEQSWLSASGDMTTHCLILTRFLELPDPLRPVYPGEGWLVFNVDDVDETCQLAQANGGSVYRAGEDRPEHSVRAAVIADYEGHYIELVGPMKG